MIVKKPLQLLVANEDQARDFSDITIAPFKVLRHGSVDVPAEFLLR